MEKISSLNNKKIKNLIYLLSNKGRNENREFLVFDLTSIKKANKLGLLKEVYSLNEIDINVPSFLVSKEVMNKVNKGTEIIGVVKFLDSKNLTSNKIIYLDEISDPSNLGKIIYLMNKYHYKDLLLSSNSTSIYNKKCLDIAKDNIFNININYGDISSLTTLKEKGYSIISTGLKSSTYLSKFKLPNKFCLVFGNESHGVSEDILNISDKIIKIEITNLDSLNVAAAASILLSKFN